jgi:hypothetical protein
LTARQARSDAAAGRKNNNMNCSKCNAHLDHTIKFCSECGTARQTKLKAWHWVAFLCAVILIVFDLAHYAIESDKAARSPEAVQRMSEEIHQEAADAHKTKIEGTCSYLFVTTKYKTASDLTLDESQKIDACRAFGLFHR